MTKKKIYIMPQGAKKMDDMTPEEIRFNSLLITFDKYPVSFAMAAKTVGGVAHLNRLLEIGLVNYIEEPKSSDAPNKKRKIDFSDCIRYSKTRLKNIRKMQSLQAI